MGFLENKSPREDKAFIGADGTKYMSLLGADKLTSS